MLYANPQPTSAQKAKAESFEVIHNLRFRFADSHDNTVQYLIFIILPCCALYRTISHQVNNGSTVNELENLLGGVELAEDGTLLSAEAMRIFILLENTETVQDGDYTDPIPEAWEETFISDAQVRILPEKSRGAV